MAAAPKKPPAKPFTMVRRSIWDSRRFASLPDDAHRYLYLYLLTCPHQSGTGCFRAKPQYILADLDKMGADWTPESYASRLTAIAHSGLIVTDDATGEILVAGWWKDNGPSNESWFAGAKKQCEAIESPKLREVAQAALADCWETFQSARGLPARPGASQPDVRAVAAERLAAITARIGAV